MIESIKCLDTKMSLHATVYLSIYLFINMVYYSAVDCKINSSRRKEEIYIEWDGITRPCVLVTDPD